MPSRHRYSLERLAPGNKVTAQFIIEQQPPWAPLSLQQQLLQQQSTNTGAAAPAAEEAIDKGGGFSGAESAGVSTDVLGVPRHTAGMWLTPWLR